MRKIVLTIAGLLSLSLLVPVPGCSSDDTSTPTDTTGGAAGSTAGTGGTAGTGDAGTGGTGGTAAGGAGAGGTAAGGAGAAGAGDAGAAGAGDAGAAGAAGGGDAGAAGAGTCPPANAPPISKCDAPDSDCVKCFCDDSGTATDCKSKWEACEQDADCNKAVACFGACGDDPMALQKCAPLAGKSLPKALALQGCNGAGKVCGPACGN